MIGQKSNINQRELGYRAVIPFYILWDTDLNGNDLRFYGQIEQMESNPSPNANASFSYQWIANALGINRRNAINIANKLKKKGYITRTKINQKDYLWNTIKKGVLVSSSDTTLVSHNDTTLVSSSDTQNTNKLKSSNLNKESNTFSITKESEIEEVIQKAQECLEKTKENLPSKASEIVPYKYQETNLPAKVNLKPLTVLQEINSLGLPDEYLDELIKIRKVNGGKVTPKAMKAVYQELIKLKKAGLDLNECLSMYANCGWKGFVADWFINAIKGKKNPYDFYTSDDISWGEEMKNNPFYHGLLD